jgi:alkylhydroperoxidase family enzyme
MSGADRGRMTDTSNPAPTIPMLSVEDTLALGGAAGMRPDLASIHFYRILVQSPQAARVESEINDRILWEGRLTVRPEANKLRELAIMRVAWVTKCEYLWAHHFSPKVDKDLPGKRPANVLAVRDGADSPDLAPDERATVKAVDELIGGPGVSPETMAELRSHLDNDGELVELVYVIAIWHAITKIMASVRVPLEPEYTPWAPDGQAPR